MRSLPIGKVWLMRCALLALVWMLAAYAPALAAERKVDHKADHKVEHKVDHKVEHRAERACLTAAQAREKIAERKLIEPFRVMLAMSRRFKSEAIGVRLCRRKAEFIYEISLLRRDGRVIHVFLKASNGQLVRATNVK
ncbi:MAG: hypothetical protein EPN75_01040 [Beijerinckiaceae bacterium]|nr:MAG: hypothetical protein EPN75_01040 [Beijerinckiaceae bacterium]